MGKNISNHIFNELPSEKALQVFVNNVLQTGQVQGRYLTVGILDKDIIKTLASSGVQLVTDYVILTDRTILKYLFHSKKEKGATLPFNEFWKISNLVKNPKNIYRDIKTGDIIFILTSRRENKVIKAVVHLNYYDKKSKNIFNYLKSIGIIDPNNLNDKTQYIKIK